MITKARSIGRAALLRSLITSTERMLLESIEDAQAAGRQDIADKLSASLALVERGHHRANESVPLIAEHFGETDQTPWLGSGPEDKPTVP